MFIRIFLLTMAAVIHLHLSNADQGFVPNVPEECLRLGYCNQTIPDYPEEHVSRLIRAFGLQNANQSVVDRMKPTRNQDPKVVELCAYIQEELIPTVAKDTNGTWNFIINSKLRYTQKYLVEICNKTNVACSPVAHFPTGYHGSCQQNFITKVMLALDHSGRKIEKKFRIPSNCHCIVREDDDRHTKSEDVTKLYPKKKLAKKFHKNSKGRRGRH